MSRIRMTRRKFDKMLSKIWDYGEVPCKIFHSYHNNKIVVTGGFSQFIPKNKIKNPPINIVDIYEDKFL